MTRETDGTGARPRQVAVTVRCPPFVPFEIFVPLFQNVFMYSTIASFSPSLSIVP